jgi:hypothetical protein
MDKQGFNGSDVTYIGMHYIHFPLYVRLEIHLRIKEKCLAHNGSGVKCHMPVSSCLAFETKVKWKCGRK